MSLTTESRVATQCVCCASADLLRSPAILMPFVADRVFGWKPVVIDASWGLHTIAPGHAYSICNSLLCTACNLLFLDIRFTDQELAALYADYRGADYVALRETYEPGYRERNSRLEVRPSHIDAVEDFLRPFVKLPLRTLDWGGNSGRSTPFRGPGNTTHVYDISGRPTVEHASAVSLADARSQPHDLVVCSHVLEHVPFPLQTLEEIGMAVQAGTLLYIEVPLEELTASEPDPVARLHAKRHWHEHINFFTPDSMRALIARAGFVVHAEARVDIPIDGRIHAMLQFACRLPD